MHRKTKNNRGYCIRKPRLQINSDIKTQKLVGKYLKNSIYERRITKNKLEKCTTVLKMRYPNTSQKRFKSVEIKPMKINLE